MTSFGLTLSSEEHPPRRLVELGALAEEHGFDFVSISDHFHPWVDAQGHSPFVWSVLGALAERTSHIDVAVGVTCPIMRIHPAVLAQAAATTGQLLDGRFTWGVGTGEALNEHITGQRWPIAPDRIDMLAEAIDVIRQLWSGDEVTFRGEYFTIENARVYDPPTHRIPIIVSAFAPQAAKMAAAVVTACGQAATQTSSRRGRRPAVPAPSTARSRCAGEPTRTRLSSWPIVSGPTAVCPVSSTRTCPHRPTSSRRRPSSPRT